MIHHVYQIRKVSEVDLAEIASIYSSAVSNRQTAHTAPPAVDYWKNWLGKHSEKYPAWVLLEEERVIGFASVSPYREGRQALEKVAEISYYLHPDHQGKGAGTFLLQQIIERTKQLKFKFLVAILLGSNSASIALLKKAGFEKWGELPGLAEFGAHTTSHLYYGRLIGG